MTHPSGATWRPLAARPPRWRRRVPSGRRWALPPLAWLLLVLGLLLVAAVVWIAVTGMMARSALASARDDLESMRTHVSDGDTAAASADARAFRRHAHRAHTLTTGPAWSAAASIPRLGSPARTVRGSTTAVDHVGARVVSPVVGVLVGIDPSRIIGSDGVVDTAPLRHAAPVLADATAAAAESRASVAELPASTWLNSVDTARGSLLQELDRLHTTLGVAATTARIAPDMLGATTPKRYFVGLLNTAEARGLGGLPGAFVILVADHGRLRITHFESDTALAGLDSHLDLGAEYVTRYGLSAPTKTYVNSTISPHFPYAARIWAALWQQKSGEHVDGAVSVDPTALGYLLDVTGPARLPGGEQVAGGSVVRLTERDLYRRFTNGNQRKEFLLAIARAVDTKILGGSSRPTAFVKAAGRAVGERRLLLWSAGPSTEQALAGLPIGGTLPETPYPFSMMTVTNAAGGKLDYYLDRRLRWTSTGCGAQRRVTVTATLTNSAPAGLPAYVVIRADHPTYAVKPGDNRVLVDYFATDGAQLRALTVDGRAATVRTSTERGHPVFSVDLEIPRGSSRTVTMVMTEPGDGPPRLMTQPLVRPVHTTVDVGACR
ncbi:MAG: DUF4012 domain-containing protein [bacterium]